jgi:hypothetical protein
MLTVPAAAEDLDAGCEAEAVMTRVTDSDDELVIQLLRCVRCSLII